MIDWLFNLTPLPPDDQLRIGWLSPWPAWLWVVSVVVCALFVSWCYRGLAAPSTTRRILAGIRGLILILVVILLNGPVLESSRANLVPDQVIMLLDRSGSMSVPDVTATTTGRQSRDDQLRDLLESIEPTLQSMGSDRRVRWFGFHGHAFELPVDPESPLPRLDIPTGVRTRIDESLARSMARSARGPVSAIVLFSDGRSDQDLQTRLLADIRAEGVPIIAVPLGSREAVGDLVLEQIRAPETAFLDDQIPVNATVLRTGSSTTSFDLVLRDRQTGRVLDRRRIESGDSDQIQATLLGVPERGGTATWSVTIEPERPDLVDANNRAEVDIALLDDPLSVLYVEGGPRWEYRYLKNLLIREPSIESSIMLLSADNTFAQEGDRPLSRLPVTAEEFEEFDVVIIGDVPSGILSPEQQHLLVETVGGGGTGILWIAGESATPSTWSDSELVETIPFTGPYALPAIGSPIQVQSTPEADRLGVLQLSDARNPGWPRPLQDEQVDWSKLQWSQWVQADQLKPTTSVLAETIRIRDRDRPIPLVMGMRYGQGRSVYVTTDEIWRWRYGRGEKLGEQFWIQLIRHLGRASLSANRGAAELIPSQRQLPVGEILSLRLNVFDDDVLADLPEVISGFARDAEDRVAAELTFRRNAEDRDTWLGTWLPSRPGTYRLTAEIPGVVVDTQVRIEDTSREYLAPESDHAALESLVEWSSGHLLEPDQIQSLTDLLPDRSVTEMEIRRAGLWDAPIVFIVMVLLLTAEWICRRLVRLA